MQNLSHGRRTVTFERVVYGLALRSAIRLGGAFKSIESGRQYVIVLRLPAGADFYEYAAAANILVRETEPLSQYTVTSPTVSQRGVLNYESINTQLKLGRPLVVVWPAEHDLPREMELIADRVVGVEEVRSFHLVAAAKRFAGQVLDLDDAKRMLSYPLPDVFSAFRTKRPASAVLERLAQSTVDVKPLDTGPHLDDLVGYGDAKVWGLSLALDIKAWSDGKLSWSDVDRGLLLSGPPGTGKTMFAGALARTCGAHLVSTSVAKWQSAGHLGDTLKAMRRSFDDAIAHRPSILFIDEFEGIGDRARMVGNEHETYWTQVINLLLELIDGHERLEGVVVIGATNYPDGIDPALLRPGRLDRHIKILLPDADERKQLSRFYLGSDISDADVEMIAAASTGLSGAHFEKAGREARRIARRAGRAICSDDVLGVFPTPRKIVSDQRRIIAIHEAGHAVVGVRLGVGTLSTVAVPWQVHASQPLGFAQFDFDETTLLNRRDYLDRIALLLAGRTAEEVILDTVFDGAGAGEGSDLHKASDLATSLEFQFGMGEGLAYFDLQSVKKRDLFRQGNPIAAARVERVLKTEMERCREIVIGFREAIDKIANILVEKALIDGSEVRSILQGVPR